MTPRMERLIDRSDEFKVMWLDPYSGKGYIAQRLKCTTKEVDSLRRELGLPEKISPSHLPAWEPTEEEIAERLSQVRAEWTSKNRLGHETASSNKGVGLKEYSFCKRTMSFH